MTVSFLQQFKRAMHQAPDNDSRWQVYCDYAARGPAHIESGEHTYEEMEQGFLDMGVTYEWDVTHPDIANLLAPFAKAKANGRSARVPFMWTVDLKRRIRERGYSDDDIFNMTPEQAWEILGGMPAPQEQPIVPPPGGWQDGADADYERGGTPPVGLALKSREPPAPALPKTVSVAEWLDRELRSRLYIAPDFLPFREVSLFNGHGGSGKTQLALQIAVAVALHTDCFTFPINNGGPVIFYTVEEEQEEIQRRVQKILDRLPGKPDTPDQKLTLADLPNLHIIAMSESDEQQYDMSFAHLNDKQQVAATPAFNALLAECQRLKPALVILENATDLFPFSELIRELVNQSMTMVRQIARKANCAVLLLQHVSESSRQTGEHKSGSTAWHNKARYRMSFAVPVVEEEGTKIRYEDDTKRILTFHKNQYGKKPENITLDNDAGYFACPHGSVVPATTYERERREEETFMALLDRDAERNIYWSPQPCVTSVLKAFMGSEEGRAIGRTKLKATLERLKKKGAVKAVLHPLKPRSKASLVLVRDRTYGRQVDQEED
jgi:RecA-family ATPase